MGRRKAGSAYSDWIRASKKSNTDEGTAWEIAVRDGPEDFLYYSDDRPSSKVDGEFGEGIEEAAKLMKAWVRQAGALEEQIAALQARIGDLDERVNDAAGVLKEVQKDLDDRDIDFDITNFFPINDY